MWKPYALLFAAMAMFLAATCAGAQTVQHTERPEVENEQEDAARAEVHLTIPRKADGTVDSQALLDQVKTAAAGGAREIQLRDRTLTEAEMQQLLSASFLQSLAAALPQGAGEHQIRIRGAADIRVQQTGNGTLRVRIEKADLTAAQRDALIQQLRAAGFDRVRIDGGPDRANRGEGGGRTERAAAERRPERAERAERAERPERAERVERPERPERVERVERVERPERSGRN
jgi:hypothetical protein